MLLEFINYLNIMYRIVTIIIHYIHIFNLLKKKNLYTGKLE